jgi:hypothetical protein
MDDRLRKWIVLVWLCALLAGFVLLVLIDYFNYQIEPPKTEFRAAMNSLYKDWAEVYAIPLATILVFLRRLFLRRSTRSPNSADAAGQLRTWPFHLAFWIFVIWNVLLVAPAGIAAFSQTVTMENLSDWLRNGQLTALVINPLLALTFGPDKR